jgi:hypothetical protein
LARALASVWRIWVKEAPRPTSRAHRGASTLSERLLTLEHTRKAAYLPS